MQNQKQMYKRQTTNQNQQNNRTRNNSVSNLNIARTYSEKSARNRRLKQESRMRRPVLSERVIAKKHSDVIPPLEKNTVRILTLGGVEEIGRNMTVVEFNDDIWIVDAGFMFREEDTPGIDYILPNTKYLEERKEKIRGILITHGHLDHTGALPYITDALGTPPIYTREFTAVMIKKRYEEFPEVKKPEIHVVEPGQTIKIGSLPVTFFGTTHTIPDSMGIIIETPYGGVVITGDIKLDHEDGVVFKKEYDAFSIFKEKKALVMLMDSTNTSRPGWSIPEHKVFETFEEIIKNAKGNRLIIGTFASQVERVIKIIELAEKYGRKVVIDGRSMISNLAIARELGYIKVKDNTIISLEEMEDYPDSQIIMLATGAQGDEYASLMRMANEVHKYVKLKETDIVVLSSSVIPGNERAVQKLKDKIARLGPKIITYETSDVHASGHGNREEAKWIHEQVNYKFFIPHHGYYYMLRVHADLAEELGTPKENIVIPDTGSVIEIRNEGTEIVHLKEKAPNTTRIVEGKQVKDIQTTVIADRKLLAQEGIFVIVATINMRTGKLKKSPDIISRGFIYLRDSQELLGQVRLLIKKIVEDTLRKYPHPDLDKLKAELQASIADYLLQQTHKMPIVIPVVVTV